MGSQDLGLPVLTQEGGFKMKCNPAKVGHNIRVGSDPGNSEGITVKHVLFVNHLQLDLENWKDDFCLQTEHREGFLDEPKPIFCLHK